MITEQENLLPVCEIFGTDNESSSVTTVNNTEPLRCHYQFKEFVMCVCHFVRDIFSSYSEQITFTERIIATIASILVLISSIIFLIIAVIRPPQM